MRHGIAALFQGRLRLSGQLADGGSAAARDHRDLGVGQAKAVIAFSNGLDSRSVAGLVRAEIGDGLVRIRLGRDTRDKLANARERAPFTSIPYRVGGDGIRMPETSARSRGFKFAVITLIGAHLAKVDRVIVPESGQGALGPALVPVGHAYADYRNHPRFTRLIEIFGEGLLGRRIQYEFPRLWFTKAETLAAFRKIAPEDDAWSRTWSCWQQSRHVSVDGHKRQCGICAACMLRRLSVHGAGLEENASRYVWEKLGVTEFEAGAAANFPASRIGSALREYTLAGTLHLQHLAELGEDSQKKRGLTHADHPSCLPPVVSAILSPKVQELVERCAERSRRCEPLQSVTRLNVAHTLQQRDNVVHSPLREFFSENMPRRNIAHIRGRICTGIKAATWPAIQASANASV